MTDGTAFGPQLRARRMAQRVSLAELAKKVHYSKGYLSKIENGLRPPTTALARLCDTVLDGNGALVELAQRQAGPEPEAEVGEPFASAVDAERWVMEMGDDGSIWFQSMNRRNALLSGAASLALLRSGAVGDSRPSEQEAAVGAFTTMFGHLRQLGQQTAPAMLLPTLVAQTHTMRSVAANSRGATRDSSLRLAARYAEYTGWMAQESGQEQAALWWTDLAVSLAGAGSDHELAAYSLVRRALVTLYAGDGLQTVALAQRAQQDPAAGARVRGLAAQREAQGHALLGRYTECCTALDLADEYFARAESGEPATVLGTSTVSNPVALTRAWCLYDLGRPAEAAHEFDQKLAMVAPDRYRFRARWGVRRALAYATAGEVDHACELTRELLGDVALVDSATVRWDLRALTRTLARWLTHPAVRDLFPALTSTIHTDPR